MLRRWLVDSDAGLDPQAWILAPVSVLSIARDIVGAPNHYRAGVAAARCAIDLLRAGHEGKRLRIAEREVPFLESMYAQLDGLPDDEDEFIEQQQAVADASKYLPGEYAVSCC